MKPRIAAGGRGGWKGAVGDTVGGAGSGETAATFPESTHSHDLNYDWLQEGCSSSAFLVK